MRFIASAALCLIVATATLMSVDSIREFGFDSLGGRAFPRALAIGLIALAIVQLVKAARSFRQAGPETSGRFSAMFGKMELPSRANIVVAVVTVIYGLILLTGEVDFIWMSAAYVLFAGFLARPSRMPSSCWSACMLAASVAVWSVLPCCACPARHRRS